MKITPMFATTCEVSLTKRGGEPPEYQKFDRVLGVRVSERDQQRAEVLRRWANSRSVSDFLRSPVVAFLDKEQRRLGITDAEIARGWEALQAQRKPRGRSRFSGREEVG